RMGGVGGVGNHALGKIKPAQVSGLTGSPSAKTVPGLSEHPGELHNGRFWTRPHQRASWRQSDPGWHRLIFKNEKISTSSWLRTAANNGSPSRRSIPNRPASPIRSRPARPAVLFGGGRSSSAFGGGPTSGKLPNQEAAG